MNNKNNAIPLAVPHMSGNEIEYVKEAFETNWVSYLGPHVKCFEKEVAEYLSLNSALALSSGTAAVHLALKYLGVSMGDVVFCSSLTFAASCNPILYEKAEPVFIDCEPESWNMSPEALERAFVEYHASGKLPKAVVITDLYGQSADYDRLSSLCAKYQVPIVEDAAEALGAKYKNKHVGTFGKLGILSFNGNKIITTGGGGMLVSDDTNAIGKCRFLSTQARDEARYYQHSELGYNYRMSNILAGIGRGQLKLLNERVQKKGEIYETYRKAFKHINNIKMMPVASWSEPNYWLSVITIDESCGISPDYVMDVLEADNIESRPVWKPMHLQPLYKGCKYYSHYENTSVSDNLFYRGLCLPSDTGMTIEEQNRVIENINRIFKKG